MHRDGILHDDEFPAVLWLANWYREHRDEPRFSKDQLMGAVGLSDGRQADELIDVLLQAGIMEPCPILSLPDHYDLNSWVLQIERSIMADQAVAAAPKDVVTQTWNFIRSRKWLAVPLMVFFGVGTVITFATSVLVLLDMIGVISLPD